MGSLSARCRKYFINYFSEEFRGTKLRIRLLTEKRRLFSPAIIERGVHSPVIVRPLTFNCPDCGSTWQEETFLTSEIVVFKRPPCPKCKEDGTLGRSMMV